MRSHAADGPDLVAAHLGRTASSVKSKAQELGVSLCRVPWAADGDLCPRCGARPVRKGAPGWREGLCEACHFSVLSERIQTSKQRITTITRELSLQPQLHHVVSTCLMAVIRT